MAGFRRVLCATDLSDAADWAIQLADREARLHGAELAILHVMPTTYPGSPMTPESLEQTVVQQEVLASAVIDAILERVESLTGRDAGQVAVLVEDGRADETIIQQADAIDADLIVLSSVGAAGDHRRLFGGTAHKVAKHAHVSVLVARPGVETGRIVLATDFAGPAEPAARLAADEAVRRCASVTVVHSIEVLSPEISLGEPGAMPAFAYGAYPFGAYPIQEMREATRHRLAETLERLGINGDIEVTEGPPADAIVRVATQKHADLIVIGTSGRTGIDRLLLGSVASSVIKHASCSVLVARPPFHVPRMTGVSEPAAHP